MLMEGEHKKRNGKLDAGKGWKSNLQRRSQETNKPNMLTEVISWLSPSSEHTSTRTHLV